MVYTIYIKLKLLKKLKFKQIKLHFKNNKLDRHSN